uniref:Hypothetical chloroplast RF2 n=1 Tax=Lobelia thermalis TaxID=2041134 RepID=A0A291F0R4_9ASTR|nr:hypothetical chloroplast RF2 [Lobelia thermalis]YP_009435731.1 hypothetical chloroplast RF2 [Lobelia thermalis]ATG25714.1 hypothetical chloroplast RF2 [Lobelia thermalis]ATG25733.1 hypothetical chloroplast RF2 [Lobelia thermalis]
MRNNILDNNVEDNNVEDNNVELRICIWQLREILREIKNSQSLLKLCNQLNSVRSVIHILFYQERVLKLLDPRIWSILLSRIRNSRTRNSRRLTFRMKITRFFALTIKGLFFFVVAVLLSRMNNRNMIHSKNFYLTGLLPTIPINAIGPVNNTVEDYVASSNINKFVASLLSLPKGKRISESSFLNPKASRTKNNWGLRWCRNWIRKKMYSFQWKAKASSDQWFDSITNEELVSRNEDLFSQTLSNFQTEIRQGKERSILWDLSFLQTERAEIESNGLPKWLSKDSSLSRLFKEGEKELINDLLPEQVEELRGNPTRRVPSFFYDGWSELHLGSKPTERSTRDPKLLKQQQDLSFVRRAETKEIVNLFKIIMYLKNTVSIHPISSDSGWELEERFHEMADLFTLSLTEPDLVYHKGFAFSIDSYGLDQKQFLNGVFNSRDEWKKKFLLVLPPIFCEETESFYRRIRTKLEEPKPKIVVFASNNILEAVNQYRLIRNLIQIQYSTYKYIINVLNRFFLLNRSDRNFEYGIQRDEIGKDTLNHRTLMKYTINQHLSNLKKSQKRWFNPLILISRTERSMNRDPDAYRYKWSTWIKNFGEHCIFEQKSFFTWLNNFEEHFVRFKIHIIEQKMGWFEIIDELSKPSPFFLSERLLKFSLFLFNALSVSSRNTPVHRSAIYISELQGPTDHLGNEVVESIGPQMVPFEKLKPSLLDDHETSRRIGSFHPRKNRRKSFDNTDSDFSTIFHEQDNWLNPVKPFHRSSLISAFYKANRLRFLNNPHGFRFDCNKRFPFYVEKARSKNDAFMYGQFLNTLFIRNKIFSLGVGKKKDAFWWRDTLSAIESQVSNIFIPKDFPQSGDEMDNLYKGRAIYSIADISATPRTEGDVVNLERTYSEGKNLHQSLNFNSNMAFIHSLCSEKYLLPKKRKKESKQSLENKRSIRRQKDEVWVKRIYTKRKARRDRVLLIRKKWKLVKAFMPWAFTLQGYRYLKSLLFQIGVELWRLHRQNKYVSAFCNIGSLFFDILQISVKKDKMKRIQACFQKWKMKYRFLPKIHRKISRIQRNIIAHQRESFGKLLLDQDMSLRNNKPPVISTHLKSTYLREFLYSTLFLLLVVGYFVCKQLGSIFWTAIELQKEFKMVQFLVMEPELLEIEVKQLLDRYPLSESNSFWLRLTDIFLGALQRLLLLHPFFSRYGLLVSHKTYLRNNLIEISNLIGILIDQFTFSINTRNLSHISKEIYSVIRKRKKGWYWVDEKITDWARRCEWVDNEEKDVLIQFCTVTHEKRIDQILWDLTDSDHFSKTEFASQRMEHPGENYLRKVIELHNKDFLNYEFDTSWLAERRIFLAYYHTLTYSRTTSEANSGDDQNQKPFSLRLSLAPARGILVIGSLGLGRSYLIKYLTQTSHVPLITIFLDKFRDTIFRFEDGDIEDDDSTDTDFDIFIDAREPIEAINQEIPKFFKHLDIDSDPRANIYPDMDDHDDIHVKLDQLTELHELDEMDTVYDVAKYFICLQFTLTKVMAPCIIWIPNIHELDFRDSGSFSLELLVQIFSWDCERSSKFERFSNNKSLVIASTHLPRQVHPALIGPDRFEACIKIRRPLLAQQQRHFATLLSSQGFSLDKDAFQASRFAAITMGSNAQDIAELAKEALLISISQGKKIIDENTIRFARHRQTWDLKAHVIPEKDPGLLFYQIGRAVTHFFLLGDSPIDPISIYLQTRLENPSDSYVYRSYYELGMSMKKVTILLYLVKCSAGSVAQQLWSLPDPNENNRIAYGRLVEDDFELVHSLLEVEGILEGFSRTDLQGVSLTEEDCSEFEESVSRTEKDCSQFEEAFSRTDLEGVSGTEKEGVSGTEKEGVSETESQFEEGVSETEKEGVSGTELEGVSETESQFEEGVSGTDLEGVSETEKDCSEFEEGGSGTEEDCSEFEEGGSRTESQFEEGVSGTEKDCSQFRVLRRPEPRNPSDMVHNGFASMIDKKFIYGTSEVVIAGRRFDPEKMFSGGIAWSPKVWYPFSFLLDWVERTNDTELGFASFPASYWGKFLPIDGVREYAADEFAENNPANDSDYDEDEGELNPNPLECKEKKKEERAWYKIEEETDDGYGPSWEELYTVMDDKFYDAFLQSLYQTRARIRSAKEHIFWRVSQFMWDPGNPFFTLSDDPALAFMFVPRDFFLDTEEEQLKFFVTSEIKSMKKSWLLEETQEARFEWSLHRRRSLRRSDRSLSNASFRAHTVSEIHQYLANLFLSNRTLLVQMHKTLVRERWLFPDDMEKFFQNFFREQYATAENTEELKS